MGGGDGAGAARGPLLVPGDQRAAAFGVFLTTYYSYTGI